MSEISQGQRDINRIIELLEEIVGAVKPTAASDSLMVSGVDWRLHRISVRARKALSALALSRLPVSEIKYSDLMKLKNCGVTTASELIDWRDDVLGVKR